MRREIRVVGGLLLAAAIAAPMVLANEAHEKRETVMKHFGALMKQNQTTLTSPSPDLAAVAANAAEIAGKLDGEIEAIFPPGSGEDSAALPIIWEDWAGFQKAEARAHDLALALESAAKGGDAKATLAAFGALGKEGCGGCHGTYRKKQG